MLKKYLFFLALSVIQANISLAICSNPEPRIRTKFSRCDVSFVGKVISERDVTEREGGENFIVGKYFTLRVDKKFRGPEKKLIEVYEDNDSARMWLEIGGKYLLFVKYQKDGKLQGWCDDAVEEKDKKFPNKILELRDVMKNI